MSLFGSKTRSRRPGPAMRRPMAQEKARRVISTSQIMGCLGVGVICAALIALIWINAERAIRETSDDTRGRVEAALTAQATTLAALAQHELEMIDQSLTVLQAAWDDNPDGFDLGAWRKKMPALTEVSDDLFIANDLHLIVQDINPAAVGQGIGSAYATFASGSLEPIRDAGPQGRDNSMLVGELGSGGVVRQYLMYMVRPLAPRPGWIIGASYRSSALTEVFASAGLGEHGLAVMIDTHRGGVQAVAGTAALRPQLDLGKTAMYRAMLDRPSGGIWAGTTPIDGVDRIIAFHRVPDRDLIVAVGVVRDQAMAPADTWAAAARTLAVIASVLVLVIGATLLWEVWHWRSTRRRNRALKQAEAMVTAMQGDLAAARVRAAADAALAQALLGGVSDGAAVFDSAPQLIACNPRFAGFGGTVGERPHEGMKLEAWVHQLAMAGRFGPAEDIDAAVARIVAELRPASGSGQVGATGPDGTNVVVRARTMPDGGLVIILGPADGAPEAVAASTADPVA
jgi:PAS domain-containing protein